MANGVRWRVRVPVARRRPLSPPHHRLFFVRIPLPFMRFPSDPCDDRAERGPKEKRIMKTFAIDNDNNITLFASPAEAAAASTTPFDAFARAELGGGGRPVADRQAGGHLERTAGRDPGREVQGPQDGHQPDLEVHPEPGRAGPAAGGQAGACGGSREAESEIPIGKGWRRDRAAG